MDYEQVGRELLVAMRGERSQVAWSRRLGYRSNVAYAWESGRRWPTAAEVLRAAARGGVDVRSGLIAFYGTPPAWLSELDPASPQAVARFLDDLRGTTSVTDLARRAGISRVSVSRWLAARTQPRLPDFLRVLEAASLRTIDWIATLADPTALPSIAPMWAQLEARLKGAAKVPWTQAVLRAIELVDYRALPAHRPGWIASRLGLPLDEEERCLAFLAETGQIRWDGARWDIVEVRAVDTRRHPEVGRALKAHWTHVGEERIRRGAPGQYSYVVFTVSQRDFERIRELHLRYFHELRALVAESQPGERVAVANVQLFALDEAGSDG